jgi:hypothetical protein
MSNILKSDLIKVFGENRDFYFVFAFVSLSRLYFRFRFIFTHFSFLTFTFISFQRFFRFSLSFRESESDFWFSNPQ